MNDPESLAPSVDVSPLDTPPPLDKDELGYPDGLYQYILNMCFFHPINIIAGFYYGNPLGGTMGTALFLSSVNYWKYPVIRSPRRYIDMATAFIAVPYHIYLSLFTQNKLLCAGLTITGAAMYPLSIWFTRNNHIKPATFCHCLLHGFVISGATFTYRDYYLYPK